MPQKIMKASCIILFCLLYVSGNGQQKTFVFPGGGEKNNNSTIGDFCCTGETATIYNNINSPVGYIYYYDFKDGINVSNTESIASDFSLLVSATPANAEQERIKDKIYFSISELYRGSTKSLKLGALRFSATILDVRKYSDPQYYVMGSVQVRVVVNVPVVLTPDRSNNSQNPTENNVPDNSNQPGQDEPVKRILDNGEVEISYADGSKKIIYESGSVKFISPDGRVSGYSLMTVPTYIPPNLPDENINQWLTSVSKSLLSFIKDQLHNDQTSIDNLLAAENNLNIYQIINRRFRFIQSLNSK